MLEAAIFDMDGVIIDSHPAHRQAWKTFLLTVGRRVSDAELDFVLDGRKREEILRHFLGELSEEEILQYGNQKDDFFRERSLQVTTIPGVIGMIDRLHRAEIAMAIATSASESRARHVIEHLELADKFDVVVTGNDVARGKPDPSIYFLACQRLGTVPENAFAFEDAASGVQAARAAGLMCVGVSGHQSAEKLRAAGATYVIENFLDLSLDEIEELLISHRRHTASQVALTDSL